MLNNICNDQALSRGVKAGTRLWSEDLAQAGYDLRFAGKWHVSVEEGPAQRGWREHFVSARQGDRHGWSWEQYRALAETPEPQSRPAGQILRPGYGDFQLYGEDERPNQHDEQAVNAALEAL